MVSPCITPSSLPPRLRQAGEDVLAEWNNARYDTQTCLTAETVLATMNFFNNNVIDSNDYNFLVTAKAFGNPDSPRVSLAIFFDLTEYLDGHGLNLPSVDRTDPSQIVALVASSQRGSPAETPSSKKEMGPAANEKIVVREGDPTIRMTIPMLYDPENPELTGTPYAEKTARLHSLIHAAYKQYTDAHILDDPSLMAFLEEEMALEISSEHLSPTSPLSLVIVGWLSHITGMTGIDFEALANYFSTQPPRWVANPD